MAEDDRLVEYRIVVEDTVKLSDRRQTVNDLFLGVNSLFLTAAGFVAVSSHLTSWWTTGICAAIAAVAVAINWTWVLLIQRYRKLTNLRIRYLEGLEKLLQDAEVFGPLNIDLGKGKGLAPFKRGVYLFEAATLYAKGPKVGFFQLERLLALIFIAAYPLLAGVVAALTYCVMAGMLPPLKLG